MTKAELYAYIDDYIKVNPLATGFDKTRGSNIRELLKMLADFTEDSASPEVPFDGERQITAPIPGLQGKTLHGSTVSEVVRNLLNEFYPAVPPAANIDIVNPTRELGDKSDIDYVWQATKNTNPITSIKVNGVAVPPTGASQSGSGTVMFGNTSVSIIVQAGEQQAADSASVGYYPARYWGPSEKSPADMIAALTDGTPINYSGLGLQKQLATNKLVSDVYNCTGGKWIYVLYDASYGNVTSVLNGPANAFSAYDMTDVTIKDQFGESRSYKLFYTGKQTGSAVDIRIVG